MGRVAERIAGGRLLQADSGDDIAGADGLDVLPVVRVHPQDPPDAFLVPVVELSTKVPVSSVPE